MLFVALLLVQQCSAQTTPYKDITTKYVYDVFGNIASVTRSTGDGYIDTTTLTYQYDLRSWLVAMPTKSVQSSMTPDGQSTTRTTQFVSDMATGALASQTIEPYGDESTYQLTNYQLDAHGVLTGIVAQDQSGKQKRAFSFRFDSEDLYPALSTNALGHTELFSVYPAFGVLAAYQDINGVVEKLQYDGFGRLKHIAPPDGDDVWFTYKATPFYEIDSRYATGQLGGVNYDANRNEVEHDLTGFDGTPVAILTRYNSQNLVSEQDGPCFKTAPNCATSGSEQYSYDELGRPTGVTHADGSHRLQSYLGLKLTRVDELQNQQYLVLDQMERVTRSVALVENGREVPINFSYQPFGLLQTLTDTYGNVARSSYDVRGRQLTLQDPDSGNHSYQWSAFDELQKEQDGSVFYTTYNRDILGRVTTIRDNDGTATFCWDTALHGIGKIGCARSTDGIATDYTYDAEGRISNATWTLDRKKYTVGVTYDSVGRVDTITYPPGGRTAFAVKQRYNPFGFLEKVIDANTSSLYWKADGENERAQIIKEEFGNGLSTQRTYDIRGRLTDIQTTGSQTQQHLSYGYFPTNSLQCRADRLASFTEVEQFLYDPLDRLKDWSVGTQPNGPSLCPVGESHPTKLFEQVFNYDDIGNLKQRNTTYGTGVNLVYQYGQNQAGPHAVTQVNSDAYTYDTRGDQISGPTRRVRYKTFGLPSQIKENKRTLFQYDASQQRVKKERTGGGTIRYVAGLYEQRSRKRHSTEIFYIQGAGRFVAQVERTKSSPSGNPVFFHDDHLGSIQMTTNGQGATQEQVWYEPFGQTVSPANPGNVVSLSSGVNVGFTGQIEDGDLGLVNMRGRIYDPKIARFLTPDPIVQDPLRGESLNRYSYAWNNPLKWIDPSGFQEAPPPDNAGADPSSGGGDAGQSGNWYSGSPNWLGPVVCGPNCTLWWSTTDPSAANPSASDNGVSSFLPPAAPATPGPTKAQTSSNSIPSIPQATTDAGVRNLGDFLNLPLEAQFQQLKDAQIPVQSVNGRSLTPPMSDAEKLNLDLENEKAMALAAYGGSMAVLASGLQRPLQSAADAIPAAGIGMEMIVGPYGTVSRATLETAASSGGETIAVVTRLTSTPQAGRALSVATGEGAQALANAARGGGQVYSAQIPAALVRELERVGLAQPSITRMGGVTGTEISFLPAATEFIVRFFK